MNQKEFLKLFSINTKKIQYSASDDLKGKKGHSDRGFKPNIQAEDIKELNKKGYGIYFTVNKFPVGQRKKNKCLGIRAVFVEDDESGKLVENWPIPPSIIVNSSKGKYHYYWLTKTKKFDEYERVMQTMVDKYHCDNHARDISRVLRLPSTYHHKSKKHRVKIVGGTFKKHSWEKIKIAFPPADKKKSNYSGSDGNFNMKNAIQELISTNDLHGSMISIALSCANRGMNKDLFMQTMDILHTGIDYDSVDHKRQGDIASRFSERHLDECYDSALLRIEMDDIPRAKKIKIDPKKKSRIPKFPADIMETWPDPWPLIWKEYQKIPRTLEKELLVPTILSIHSYLLNSAYTTEWGLRPNLAFLGIAMSTANKDINSKRVIRSLDIMMKEHGFKISPFTNMATGSESLTSDTAFLESFDDKENFFWINTEATHIFQMMSQGGSNAHVKALESKIIDVVDGQEIMGKTKASKKVKSIKDPNCQILLYTQPETISTYLKANIIDSGLLGRMIITVHGSAKDPFDQVFKRKKKFQKKIHSKLAEFYGKIPVKNSENPKKVLMPTDEGLESLTQWMKTEIKEKANGDDNRIKMLKRLEITAEQLYTLILGISQMWGERNKVKIENFDANTLIPLLNYWADCKLYAINEYVDTAADPLAEAIIEVMRELISGELKVQTSYKGVVSEYHAIPIGEVYRIIKKRKKLLRTLEANFDIKNLTERVNKVMKALEVQGLIIEVEISNKKTKYYGFPA